MKLLSILILFTTAVAAAALGSSGDEAVLDLEETPTLRGLKSRNCDGVGPNTCDNRSNCIWNDNRSRRQQQRQGIHGRNRSNGRCEYRDSGYYDDDSCRGLGRRSCTNRINSNYCRWSNSKDRCVDRDQPDHDDHFCPELSRSRCTNRSNSYFCKWENGRCRYRNLPDHYDPIPLRHVANDRSPRNKYPLGLCEGDCDSDKDCEAGLECMKRDNYEPVPGCTGSRKFKAADFCIEKDRRRRSNECVRSSDCRGDEKCRWRNGRKRCILL